MTDERIRKEIEDLRSLGPRGGRHVDTHETWPHREEEEQEAAERAENARRIQEAVEALPAGERRQVTWCYACRRAWPGHVTPEGHPAEMYPLQEHSLARYDFTPTPPDDGECRECFEWRGDTVQPGFAWWQTCDRKTCGHEHHKHEILFA
jgi:hypothetical protein